ncbi:uncharacterized protein N7469_005285 [Penicillium citrinum]|uniref:Uncharacterized protein n=2 Tax=Penicillium TaxID=5073 RepID=A0A9W9P1A9_PENCI|nr:uncharacterized protein N7469_005285 [Penicillium citrinum]KAJ5233519.1 hypothetical protein N7469_005285 [Penicillium citrinum]KAJ5573012.1 hypothetical protein N7450_009996 [Penicillium hetheringtonii]
MSSIISQDDGRQNAGAQLGIISIQAPLFSPLSQIVHFGLFYLPVDPARTPPSNLRLANSVYPTT